jgi:anti-sigma regulatory factor (Ser/Thr protein kinase)
MSDRRQTWHFPPDDRVVSLTRSEAAKTVADWGRGDLADDVALIVSELVTNAIRHGQSPNGSDITLTLCVTGRCVTGEVCDHGDGKPRQANPGDDIEGGRGLLLVAAYTTDWGVSPLAGGGKRVWFELCAEAS